MKLSSSFFVLALLSAGLANAQTVKAPAPGRQLSLDPPRLGTDRLITSAVSLTGAFSAPSDASRLFLLEQRGRIMVLDLNTQTVNATPFLDIDAICSNGGGSGESGLLGLAFHPNYVSNGLFYIHYSRATDGAMIIAEYARLTADTADAGSARILLTLPDVNSNHNAGWLGFSPLDGYLYICTGDGGNACDSGGGHTAGTGNAQDLTSNLYGKMLRIDPTGGVPYAIPGDNPFVGISGDDEIWAYGLRNPWRASFDSATGDLYIGDVGQDKREEIDYQSAASVGGENYGWRCREGNICSAGGASNCVATTGCACPSADPGMTAPIHDMSHQSPPAPATGICAVVGGYVYRGSAFPHIVGHYFFADFCGNAVWGFTVHNGVKLHYKDWKPDLSPSLDGFNITAIRSFAEDANGELYIVTTTAVYKIVPRP